MKPQARPFTVEVKNRRRPAQVPDANWSIVIDEPSPDDLPSHHLREDAADTPFWAASRVFSAFTSNAISTASTLGELATSVFASKLQDQPAEAPAIKEGRTGRILPSLLSPSPSDTASAQGNGSGRKAAKAKRPRKRALELAEKPEAAERTEAAASPEIPPIVALDLSVTATGPSTRDREANRRRADVRVPAGERWKRRRLPKACW